MSRLALLDTPAWARLVDGRLGGPAGERVLDALAAGGIAMTEPLLLEIHDHDYDVLAEHTLLAFGSVWVAPRGSAG